MLWLMISLLVTIMRKRFSHVKRRALGLSMGHLNDTLLNWLNANAAQTNRGQQGSACLHERAWPAWWPERWQGPCCETHRRTATRERPKGCSSSLGEGEEVTMTRRAYGGCRYSPILSVSTALAIVVLIVKLVLGALRSFTA